MPFTLLKLNQENTALELLLPAVIIYHSYSPKILFGGASRDRTDDPLRARQMLSQLSYGPFRMVGLGRLELPTSPLSGVRSNHLSYRPVRASLLSFLFSTKQIV
jgi:hypothetical protein